MAGAHDLDHETVVLLRESAHEIEAAVEAEEPHEGPLEARLTELAGQLHESNPAVAEAVRRVVNALANLGI